jgi:hypothetical protein
VAATGGAIEAGRNDTPFGHVTAAGGDASSRDERRIAPLDASHARAGLKPVIATDAKNPDTEVAFVSDFAGVFFLLNVACDLGWYASGVTICEELNWPIWDLLRRAGIDGGGEDFGKDPVCAFLDRLPGEGRPSHPALPRGATQPSDIELEDALRRVREHATAVIDAIDPPALVVRQRGRIVLTAAHLNVHFSLQHHPIELRAARFDRNPGWMPAAGLHVAFLFD